MDKLEITPKTKIYDLLEAYPQLEEVLLGFAPQFEKLKNPLLRRTITKITNLSQAATIGGIRVEELVNAMRSEVNQVFIESDQSDQTSYIITKPLWFKESSIVGTVDIRDMLHAGEQPVHEVLSAIRKLGDQEILKVIAPFVPAPLLDKSLGLNYLHWLDEKAKEEVCVYFMKGPSWCTEPCFHVP
ncbi:MAG: DUF1858 domain-containing protein [Bacteroidota bacterium]